MKVKKGYGLIVLITLFSRPNDKQHNFAWNGKDQVWFMFVINMWDTFTLLLRCPFPRIKAELPSTSPYATHIGLIWSFFSFTTYLLLWQGNQGLQELSSSSPQLQVLYWPMWSVVNATRVSLGLSCILSPAVLLHQIPDYLIIKHSNLDNVGQIGLEKME